MKQSSVLKKIHLSDFILIPNLFSLFRMLLVVPVIFALKNHHQGFLVFLIFIGLISDALDGFFARKI